MLLFPIYSSTLVSVVGAKILPINANGTYIHTGTCAPIFPGWKHCTALVYPDDAAPFFPLNSDTK